MFIYILVIQIHRRGKTCKIRINSFSEADSWKGAVGGGGETAGGDMASYSITVLAVTDIRPSAIKYKFTLALLWQDWENY